MDENSVEELISQRAVQLLANRTGFDATKPEKDYGVDLVIKEVVPERRNGKMRFLYTGRSIDVQLKASKNLEERHGYISYALEKKTYLDFLRRKGPGKTPFVIIVFQLPKDEADWLSVSGDDLIVRKCAYYYVPTCTERLGLRSVRIKIPSTNMVGLDYFKKILDGSIKWQ